MDVRVLRYFLAVAREGNMTRAADRLHVTQPTLSRQLKSLEETVGKKLFLRTNYAIKLTDEGLLLKKRAEDIIEMVDKTLDEFRALEDISGGDIYVGSAESESIKYFARAAKKLKDKHPSVCFHLYSENTEIVTERLDKGLLDFAIIAQEVDSIKYNSIKLPSKDTWGLIMRKDNLLAAKETISQEDLLHIPLIVSRQGITEDYPKWFGDHIDDLNIVATFDLIYNASFMVKEGLGYALSFDKIVNTGNESDLCFRPLEPALETSMYVIWKKHQIFSPIVKILLQEIEEIIKNSAIASDNF